MSRADAGPEGLQASARRARHLVHLGELSAARRALSASPLAPGNEATLQELRDRAADASKADQRATKADTTEG